MNNLVSRSSRAIFHSMSSCRAFSRGNHLDITSAGSKPARPRFVPKENTRYSPKREFQHIDERPGWEKHENDLGPINPMWKAIGAVVGGTILTTGFYLITQSMHHYR